MYFIFIHPREESTALCHFIYPKRFKIHQTVVLVVKSDDMNLTLPEQIGNFKFIRHIGTGMYGQVWVAEHATTKSRVAIKIISKKEVTEEVAALRFQREIYLMKQLDHPFIAQLFLTLEDENHHYLIMEYAMNGNLLSYINDHGRMIEPVARKYFLQIISAIEYMHKEKHICHRDLKAENILLDQNLNIRLTDFGFSREYSTNEPNLSTQCGSPAYLSPEIVKGHSYTAASDYWSVGVMLFAMIVGKLPFQDETIKGIMNKIVNSNPTYPPFVSECLVDLLSKLLAKEPEKRITIDKIKEHPWCGCNELSRINQISHDFTISSNLEEIVLDKEIISFMQSNRIDTTNLSYNLCSREYNEATCIYMIMRKERITNQIKYNSAFSTTNTIKTFTPQPSTLMANQRRPDVHAEQGNSTRIIRKKNDQENPPNVPTVRPVPLVAPRVVRRNPVRPIVRTAAPK